MSETETPPAEGEKKKGSKLFLIIGLVLVLAIGGGAGYYFFVMSAGAKGGEEKAEKNKKGKKDKEESDDSNELELKSSKSEDDEENDDEKSSKDSVKISLPDDEHVKSVIELTPFVVNLADEDEPKYLRMTVSLGIGGDESGGGHEPDQLFLTRVKNAMLSVLGTKKADDVLSVKGKALLRKQLLKAAQTAAEDGHIEALYITDFIVQL